MPQAHFAQSEFYAKRNFAIKHLAATTTLNKSQIGRIFGLSCTAVSQIIKNPHACMTNKGGFISSHVAVKIEQAEHISVERSMPITGTNAAYV